MHNYVLFLFAVSPDAIHEHVKTKIGAGAKPLHYAAPEFAVVSRVETSADIYAFGICALEVRKCEDPLPVLCPTLKWLDVEP